MSNLFFRQIEVGQHAVFAYLIGDLRSHEAIVVDPADDVDELITLANRNHLKIKEIINTHGHVDHIMGNAEMQEKTGAAIKIHESEAKYLENIGHYWLKLFNARKSPPADGVLADGDSLRIGDFEWRVIHTPGHTPGGICLYNSDCGICLTGDTLFVGSVGRVDGPRSSGIPLAEFHQNQTTGLARRYADISRTRLRGIADFHHWPRTDYKSFLEWRFQR